MWTVSGFADEIDPDLETQCAVLNELGITHVEFRSAWDTNVLDLTDEQVEDAAAVLAGHGLSVSSIGSRSSSYPPSTSTDTSAWAAGTAPTRTGPRKPAGAPPHTTSISTAITPRPIRRRCAHCSS